MEGYGGSFHASACHSSLSDSNLSTSVCQPRPSVFWSLQKSCVRYPGATRDFAVRELAIGILEEIKRSGQPLRCFAAWRPGAECVRAFWQCGHTRKDKNCMADSGPQVWPGHA